MLASGDYTFVAINNVPVAGAATGAFVDFLVSQGAPLTSFHLIGFSMGVRDFFLLRNHSITSNNFKKSNKNFRFGLIFIGNNDFYRPTS